MTKACFVIKSEPTTYSFAQLVKEKKTRWDGIRNYEARNNLRAMAKGDLLLFYHSGDGKEIVGLAEVTKTAYQDPTTTDDWSAVDVAPIKAISKPVTLATLKGDPLLANMQVVRKSRISVTPVTAAELKAILKLGATKL